MSTTLLCGRARPDDVICAERPGANILLRQWILSSFFASSSPSRSSARHVVVAMSSCGLGAVAQPESCRAAWELSRSLGAVGLGAVKVPRTFSWRPPWLSRPAHLFTKHLVGQVSRDS